MRKIFVQVACIPLRHNKELESIYVKIAEKSQVKRAIIVARKLIGHIKACFRRGELYKAQEVELPTLNFENSTSHLA